MFKIKAIRKQLKMDAFRRWFIGCANRKSLRDLSWRFMEKEMHTNKTRYSHNFHWEIIFQVGPILQL